MNKKYIFIAVAVVAVAVVFYYVNKRYGFLNLLGVHPDRDEVPATPKPNKQTFRTEPSTTNFSKSEWEHSGNGTPVPIEYYGNLQELMEQLEVLRAYLATPITITYNGGYRDAAQNERSGGVENSQHLVCRGADIKAVGKTALEVQDAVYFLMSTGQMKMGGIGFYNTFTHYDTRGSYADWPTNKKRTAL